MKNLHIPHLVACSATFVLFLCTNAFSSENENNKSENTTTTIASSAMYEPILPWDAYKYWRVDSWGTDGEPGKKANGKWYRVGKYHPGYEDQLGEWGQFICWGEGNLCPLDATATGWNPYKGKEWEPTGEYVAGPFTGKKVYNPKCGCFE